LVSEETFGFGGDVWFWRRRLGSVARHGCFVQFHDWFLVSLAALICYHRRKELDGAVRLRASDDVGDRGGKGGSTLEGLGFGAGQRMVGSGQRALKGPGIPLSGSSLQISRLRRSLSRPPLSFLSISLYLCLRARLGGVRLGPGGLGVGRSIVSGHQLSLAPRPGLGADRRRRLVSEETFGFGGDVWFRRRRLVSEEMFGFGGDVWVRLHVTVALFSFTIGFWSLWPLSFAITGGRN
jgi:hypothetical protein